MTLYEFDIADLAKPVETKKRKSKKEAPNIEYPIAIGTHNANRTGIQPESMVESGKPVKKPRTEKQIAALEKAKETRRLKKEEIENAKKAIQDEIANKEAELQAKQEALALKKEAQKEKRKLAREAKNSASETSLDREVNVEVAKVVSKPKNKSIAPPWFTEHLAAKEAKKKARSSQLQEIAKPRKADKEYDSGKEMNALFNAMFPGR